MNSMGQLGPILPDLPSTLELCGRILLAAFLGAVIGLEREINDHPSGLRTHIAVAIGACLFGICSAYAFTEFIALRNDNNYQVDVTRIASQVVVGVGFLGGGAIIKQGNNVRGLTSAAGLWVSSAVGLAVALGLYVETSTAVVTLVVLLVLLKRPGRWLRRQVAPARQAVSIAMPIDADPSEVISTIGQMEDMIIHSVEVTRQHGEGVTVIDFEFETQNSSLQTLLRVIDSRSDVIGVEVTD